MNAILVRTLMVGGAVLVLVGCARRAPTQVTLLDVKAEAKEPEATKPVERFAFANDAGGKLLTELLPADQATSARPRERAEPRKLPAPRSIEQPELPLSGPQETLPQVKRLKDGKAVRPRMLPSEPPLVREVGDFAPPREMLPAGALTWVPSRDVEKPMRVPTLSQPLSDRVGFDDPTAAFSLGAVLATPAPERASPVPVWFLNLPDPFENHHVNRLLALPPEDSLP